MIFTTQTDLGFTPILLDQAQQSSVRSTEFDCRWDCTNHSLAFHCVKAIFPQIEKVKFSHPQFDYDLPALYFDRGAKLFQALRSNHGDLCQDIWPDCEYQDEAEALEEIEDEPKYPCPLGYHEPAPAPTAYSIEDDFAAWPY